MKAEYAECEQQIYTVERIFQCQRAKDMVNLLTVLLDTTIISRVIHTCVYYTQSVLIVHT